MTSRSLFKTEVTTFLTEGEKGQKRKHKCRIHNIKVTKSRASHSEQMSWNMLCCLGGEEGLDTATIYMTYAFCHHCPISFSTVSIDLYTISCLLHTALVTFERKNTYVRMLLLIIFAFKTTVPSKLILNLRGLGMGNSVCNWLFNFLACRPQIVRLGNIYSLYSLVLRIGAHSVPYCALCLK